MEEEDVLAVAAAIRPYLPHLLADEAEQFDSRIDELLNRAASGEQVKVALLRVLSSRAATREWTREAVAVPKKLRTFIPQAGRASVPAVLYTCPRCGAEWYRFSVLDAIPTCEEHEVRYEPTAEPPC